LVAERVDERGSAPLESIFAIVFLCLLVLGVIQVSFALYARNVVAASAHEGARAAVERGVELRDASAIADTTVRRAAGGLVEDLHVAVATRKGTEEAAVSVEVAGMLRVFGPVPIRIPLRSSATATARATVP